ncbi:hypothetical protein FJZ31_31995 [Candidatus Poribacteria bacterium]|nr:hypothetical protein [Candidatus Poribacteria bacterium]
MNQMLKNVFDKTVSLFEKDSRVVAAYHSGSVGTDKEDEFSDVDPVFLIVPEHFITFDKELPQLFEQAVTKPLLWWPERWIWRQEWSENIQNPRNYAIFFKVDDKLLQYDINIMAAPQKYRIKISQSQFIFDKASVLEITDEYLSPVLDEKKLVWTIQMYWIYVYIHVKYIKRRDLFKLLYAQQELFHEHLEVLRYLRSNISQQWWPLMANQVEESKKERLLIYFGWGDVDSIARALPDEIRSFSNDAQEACVKWKIEYPEAFEDAVLRYLQKNGIRNCDQNE